MATFSIGDALGSGFRLIGRRPFSVLSWGLAHIAIVAIPMAFVIAQVGPDYLNFMSQLFKAGMESRQGAPPNFDMAPMMQVQAKVMMWQPLIMLAQLIGLSVVTGAVYRAVLEPRQSAFAFLRLGGREFWLGLLFIAGVILTVILMCAVALGAVGAGLGLTALLKANQAAQWVPLATVGVCVLAFIVFFGVFIRFSMAGPMTFAAGEFRLFESWKQTKGKAFKLFALAILLWLLMVLVIIVLEIIAAAIVFTALGIGLHPNLANVHPDPAKIMAFFHQPVAVWGKAIAPWAAVYILVDAFLIGCFSAISLAPWATAYKQIKAGGGTGPLFDAAPSPSDHGGDSHGHDAHGHDDHGHGAGLAAAAVAGAAVGAALAHGHDAHGHDAHGHDAHGHDDHGHGGGHDAHGHDAHGHDAHGPDAHGHDAHADAHGHDDHGHGGGHDAHGHDDHGHGGGHDAHGHDAHGHDDHGHGGDHGHDDHGHDDHGHAAHH